MSTSPKIASIQQAHYTNPVFLFGTINKTNFDALITWCVFPFFIHHNLLSLVFYFNFILISYIVWNSRRIHAATCDHVAQAYTITQPCAYQNCGYTWKQSQLNVYKMLMNISRLLLIRSCASVNYWPFLVKMMGSSQ